MAIYSRTASLLAFSFFVHGVALAGTRQETITYHDDVGNWVLGQPGSKVVNNVVAESIEYDSTKALPITVFSFSAIVAKYQYYADGTLSRVEDGAGHVTLLSNWKRGVAQLVKNPDATTRSLTVDDNGWVTAYADENGHSTSYGYDGLGRLKSTTYPTEVSGQWNSSASNFEYVSVAEYGIGPGHWRSTSSTGNSREISYYDVFWRPVMTIQFDAADQTGTQKFRRYVYDSEARLTFSSYPSASSATQTGVWSAYDALGRIKSKSYDSESGLLTSVFNYLTGNRIEVVDYRGGRTVTTYQAFDQPSYENAVLVQDQEKESTSIARDAFGKVLSITRDQSGF